MRFNILWAGVIGLVSLTATGSAYAQAASTEQAQAARPPRPGNARETDAPPTVEQMERAVSRLRGDPVDPGAVASLHEPSFPHCLESGPFLGESRFPVHCRTSRRRGSLLQIRYKQPAAFDVCAGQRGSVSQNYDI